jgi:hypothetical protein
MRCPFPLCDATVDNVVQLGLHLIDDPQSTVHTLSAPRPSLLAEASVVSRVVLSGEPINSDDIELGTLIHRHTEPVGKDHLRLETPCCPRDWAHDQPARALRLAKTALDHVQYAVCPQHGWLYEATLVDEGGEDYTAYLTVVRRVAVAGLRRTYRAR